MNRNSPHVTRTSAVPNPDQSRVLLRPFSPGDYDRANGIIARIISLSDDRVRTLVDEISQEFSGHHQQIQKRFMERFEQLRDQHLSNDDLTDQRRLLIGAYFLAEYSLQSAARFNPSIIPQPDQTALASG